MCLFCFQPFFLFFSATFVYTYNRGDRANTGKGACLGIETLDIICRQAGCILFCDTREELIDLDGVLLCVDTYIELFVPHWNQARNKIFLWGLSFEFEMRVRF